MLNVFDLSSLQEKLEPIQVGSNQLQYFDAPPVPLEPLPKGLIEDQV